MSTYGAVNSDDDREDVDSDVIDDTSVLGLAKRTMKMALPFSVQYMLMFSVWFVGSLFAGLLGKAELAGFGAAVLVVNVAGFSTITGLVMGLDTILPQAFGASPTHPMIALYSQRAMSVAMVWGCVVAAIFLTAHYWVPRVLQPNDAEVSHNAATAITIATASLPFYALFEVLQSYLGAMNRTMETFCGALAGAAVNPLLLYFLTRRGGEGALGFTGVPVSWVLSMASMSVATIAVSKLFTGAFDSTWKGIDCRGMWSGWRPFLKVALPAMGMMMCEWSAFEVNGIIASHVLSKEQFTAFVICQNCIYIMFPPVLGILLAAGTLVGNEVGAGRIPLAKRLALVGAGLLLAQLAFDVTLLMLLRHQVPRLFSADGEAAETVARTVKYVICVHVGDSCFSYMGGLIRAHGHQHAGAVIAAIGYYGVGVPLSVVLHRYGGWSGDPVAVFWIGMGAGTFVAFAISVAFLLSIRWEQTDELAAALNFEDESFE